jgi:SAM-dependent methyltransferase
MATDTVTAGERLEHNARQRAYFEKADKRTMLPRSGRYVLRQIARVLDLARVDRSQDVVEVGSGLGRYSVPLVDAGYRLTCLDLSPSMLESLRKRLGDRGPEVIACDVAEAARHTARRFDRAVGFFTLHHIADLAASFCGLAEILRPGAVAAFCEPVFLNPLYYVQIAVTPQIRWAAERGILDMRASVVFPAMAQAGFVDPRSTSFGFLPPFLANTEAGGRFEDALERVPMLRFLHAFRIFYARIPD